MSSSIWAALLFLCMCLELGESSARLRKWESKEHLQTARKDSQVESLDVEEGQSEMPFANKAGTPSLRLANKNEDNLPKSNKDAIDSVSGLHHTQIEEIAKTGFEITLSDASVNTDSTPHILNKLHPNFKDILEITKITVSPLDQNSKISRISQDRFVPADLTPAVEETETEPGEKGPDRSTLSDASVIRLKPPSGLKNSTQEVQTIMIGSQDAESSGDFHRTFTGPNLDEMPSQSRSRRSWIWNQFFVIEEYSGPEPVLIGRVR